jgi:large subunit ribosomal protein L24
MTNTKCKIKKGDEVIVLTGKDKGTKGEVLKVMPQDSRVIVQGVNMITKHNKPTQTGAGGIEKKEASLHISNVALADPKSGKASRIGYTTLKDGKKARVARKSGETLA